MHTDEQLMELYLTHDDRRAFAMLYARQAPALRRFIQKRLFRAVDVEDVLQQTFLRLHLAKHSYRKGEPLRPWLCTIASNLIRDELRRAQRRPESQVEPALLAAEPLEPSQRQLSEAALESALEHLCEITQRIMHEHFHHDRALVEIARELGEKPATVRVRLHRGCKKLRQALHPEPPASAV